MRRVNPPIIPAPERRLIPVRIALPAERAEEHLPLIRLPIAIRILKEPDVRDAPRHTLPAPIRRAKRIQPDGDIQPIRKHLHLPRFAIRPEVRENADTIPQLRPRLRGKRILPRLRHPKPPRGVESHIHRLAQVRLRSDELDFKAGRELEFRLLLRRHQRLRSAHAFGKRIGLLGKCDGGEKEQEVAEHGGVIWARLLALKRNCVLREGAERIHHPHAVVELPVIQILRIHGGASESLGCDNHLRVEVRDLVTFSKQ